MTDAGGAAVELTAAARAWLASLPAEARAAATWDFGSTERGDWHYAPRDRAGVPLRAMDEPARAGAMRLLAATVSGQGLAKARAIMALEDVLHVLEGGEGHRRDRLNYAFTVFGKPGDGPWGWRVEGHHLIVNTTVAPSGAVAVTPTFWGANPALIPCGEHAGERVLATEYHVALELARSLSTRQRAAAAIADRSLGDIVTARGHATALGDPVGLPCAELSGPQRRRLDEVLRAHLGNARPEIADPALARAGADLAALRLGWAGGMAEGEPFSYRLHGPRTLIEFDCTPNDANHVHTVWRDPIGDWGRDILGEHYRRHHDLD